MSASLKFALQKGRKITACLFWYTTYTHTGPQKETRVSVHAHVIFDPCSVNTEKATGVVLRALVTSPKSSMSKYGTSVSSKIQYTKTQLKTFFFRCRKKCSGEVLRVNDVYFHNQCFRCKGCPQNLSHGGG